MCVSCDPLKCPQICHGGKEKVRTTDCPVTGAFPRMCRLYLVLLFFFVKSFDEGFKFLLDFTNFLWKMSNTLKFSSFGDPNKLEISRSLMYLLNTWLE